MVFLVLQIKCGAKVIKPWSGIPVTQEKMILRDLYNDFAGGVLVERSVLIRSSIHFDACFCW